jgi:hypothetical protein
MTVEPGRLLAGRYRVEDLLAERAGARLWRAVDEVLRRSVAVDVLPTDSPRASALVEAARRAAVVTDGRFLRVLDAAEENGDVYVVREWAPGEPLDRVLADGPLTHRRAAWIAHEVAEAVGVAHSSGIYHLRLVPENVIVTDTGGVKIIGLATDAALHGVRHADAEEEDVRGIGRLLYAALVACWPGGPACSLPAAPTEHGRVLRPGRVRAGVPRRVDDVCERILGDPPQKTEPLRHATGVAAILSDTARLAGEAPAHDPEATQASAFPAVPGRDAESTAPLRVDEPALAPPRSLRVPTAEHSGSPATDPGPESTRQLSAAAVLGADAPRNGDGTTQLPPTTAPVAGAPPPEPRHRGRRAWAWVGIVALVAVLAAVAFFLGLTAGDGDGQQASGDPSPAPSPQPLQPVQIASVSAFDPFGESGENDDEAPLVADGDPSTQWSTLSYQGNPRFGGLKPGLGLVLDLARPAQVRQVTVGLGGSGTSLQLRAAPASASSAPSDPGDYRVLGRAGNATGRAVLRPDRPVRTQFLLVWLTRLPPEPSGTYAATVSEISVQG